MISTYKELHTVRVLVSAMEPEARSPATIDNIHILSGPWARPMTPKTSELKVHADFPLEKNKNPKLRSCVLFLEPGEHL